MLNSLILVETQTTSDKTRI